MVGQGQVVKEDHRNFGLVGDERVGLGEFKDRLIDFERVVGRRFHNGGGVEAFQ